MPLDFTELRELLAALNQTDITELTVKSEDFELTIRRGSRGSDLQLLETTPMNPGAVMTPVVLSDPPTLVPLPAESQNPEGAAAIAAAPPPTLPDRKLVDVTSPMVGTFYRAPAPEDPPFVGVGDRIRLGQTVCIIEAMKLMNELEAEVSGEVVEILVQNGEPVEYGQALMRVSPH
ncbi:hypothetical protein DO97_13530 [Neosynechococcus sphagnicola sy1]|uniref:Biotin carboxyl carrier protein of acetyl-CoA carboxylase n=1 Tax=Neosynechococcus sphagnicola sy1 TaxID=1497020 RepID=A0A098TMH0_9CYAN|nr:acetyl-CoA carboxylase biotin carboxyl carrier protein [Neosynechococcus sphagnicola]KGF72038.1 hypothetical protein DO97_13530 [Neosynechococcus sphagnicola sy1]